MKRVIIKSNGTYFGTTVQSADDGSNLAISSASIQINPGEIIRANLELVGSELDIVAEGKFHILDPTDGVRKAVSKIIFEDGTELKL